MVKNVKEREEIVILLTQEQVRAVMRYGRQRGLRMFDQALHRLIDDAMGGNHDETVSPPTTER